MTIDELIEESYSNAKDKGFHDIGRTVGDAMLLIHSEISEAVEEWRNGNIHIRYEDGKPEGLIVELADAMIRIADLVGELQASGYDDDADLTMALLIKSAYNRGRPHLHGGKKI